MRAKLAKIHVLFGLQRMPKEEIADFRQTVEVADSIGVSLTVIRTHHAMPEKTVSRHAGRLRRVYVERRRIPPVPGSPRSFRDAGSG
jgi:hypothetical protein